LPISRHVNFDFTGSSKPVEVLQIDVIEFESNYKDVALPIVRYLESKNYIVVYAAFDIFMIHKDSVFHTW